MKCYEILILEISGQYLVAIEAVVWFCCGRMIFKSQWKIHQSTVLTHLLRKTHLKNRVSQVSTVNQ